MDYTKTNATLTVGENTDTVDITSTFQVPGTYSCTRTTWIEHISGEDRTWTRA